MRKNCFQKPHLLFEVYLGLFSRNPCLFENKKEPQRNCEQFPGSSASRSLTCVRKQRIWYICPHANFSIFPTISKKSFRVFIFGEFSKSQGRCQTNNYDIFYFTIYWDGPPVNFFGELYVSLFLLLVGYL